MTTTKTSAKTAKKAQATSTGASDFGDLINGALKQDSAKKKPAKKEDLIFPLAGNASKSIRLLAALKAIEKLVEKINAFGRSLVKDEIIPKFAAHLVRGGDVQSMKLNGGDAECLIVPMRKYAKIDSDAKIKVEALGLKVVEHKSYAFSEAMAEAISNNPNVLGEIENLLKNSPSIDADLRKRITNGLVSVVDESSDFKYADDPMESICKLADGDVAKAQLILETVAPTYTFRSYKINNGELEVGTALDMIKKSVEAEG